MRKTKIIKTPLLFIHTKVIQHYVIVTATFIYCIRTNWLSFLAQVEPHNVFCLWFKNRIRTSLLSFPFGLYLGIGREKSFIFWLLFCAPNTFCDIRTTTFWMPSQKVVKRWCYFTHVFISILFFPTTYHVTTSWSKLCTLAH